MASIIPNSFKKKILQGSIAFGTDTFKYALLTSSASPNIDTSEFFGDLNANESSGTGYSAGGVTMTNVTVTQDNTNDLAYVDADDVQWASSTIANARYGVMYKSTGVAGTSPICVVHDYTTTRSSSGDTFTVQFDSNGILKIT